jgi:signal transduction histidine kinase
MRVIIPSTCSKCPTLTCDASSQNFTIRTDAEKLQQILINLLSNAVKFTAGGGEIVISVAQEGSSALVHVRDTGIGIPADKLESIFDPFVQVRSNLTRTHEGTGLGLAISRDLARGIGGELSVDSTPGVGSTFTLVLPRCRRIAVLCARSMNEVQHITHHRRDAQLRYRERNDDLDMAYAAIDDRSRAATAVTNARG